MTSKAFSLVLFGSLFCAGCPSQSCQSGPKYGTTCTDEYREVYVVRDRDRKRDQPKAVEPDYVRH